MRTSRSSNYIGADLIACGLRSCGSSPHADTLTFGHTRHNYPPARRDYTTCFKPRPARHRSRCAARAAIDAERFARIVVALEVMTARCDAIAAERDALAAEAARLRAEAADARRLRRTHDRLSEEHAQLQATLCHAQRTAHSAALNSICSTQVQTRLLNLALALRGPHLRVDARSEMIRHQQREHMLQLEAVVAGARADGCRPMRPLTAAPQQPTAAAVAAAAVTPRRQSAPLSSPPSQAPRQQADRKRHVERSSSGGGGGGSGSGSSTGKGLLAGRQRQRDRSQGPLSSPDAALRGGNASDSLSCRTLRREMDEQFLGGWGSGSGIAGDGGGGVAVAALLLAEQRAHLANALAAQAAEVGQQRLQQRRRRARTADVAAAADAAAAPSEETAFSAGARRAAQAPPSRPAPMPAPPPPPPAAPGAVGGNGKGQRRHSTSSSAAAAATAADAPFMAPTAASLQMAATAPPGGERHRRWRLSVGRALTREPARGGGAAQGGFSGGPMGAARSAVQRRARSATPTARAPNRGASSGGRL
ncbi:hypothetical protein JKP88DRAFT_254095 [Tribonema minus]|uniref:Uncharacterized protein n=1 Tax=Tribonema minus TaxID=303371 RepID=A0A836CL00_9STRA|nr:hypothetical protein JKP88DRAFT_254095 [Tribonema minus]